MGTSGIGGPSHISGVIFQQLTGTRGQFVPYRGAAPAMQDLVAGQVDVMVAGASAVLPQKRADTIKTYAVAANNRLKSAPDIATADEAGLPNFHLSVWHGLFAPKGIIDKLNTATVSALSDPTVSRRLRDYRPGHLSARSADPAGTSDIAESRDREMVADHQGGGHQGGVISASAARYSINSVPRTVGAYEVIE